jgi:inward rectifier potassium channel
MINEHYSPKAKTEAQDPGIGTRTFERSRRTINQDGTFNVIRKGAEGQFRNLYHFMVGMSWARFFLMTFASYMVLNVIFACMYLGIGVQSLGGEVAGDFTTNFGRAFFFSVQTSTTIGYGHIFPVGWAANMTATVEGILGLMMFALMTGLLYGRFSKPTAKLLFSDKAVIAPFNGERALMFRVVNKRNNVLLEVEVTVMAVWNEKNSDGEIKRNFQPLELERKSILMLPSTWTVVHTLDEDSPLFGMTKQGCLDNKVEILIFFKGFDDSFNQQIRRLHSYTANEVVWGAKFVRNFSTNESGDTVVDVNGVHSYEQAELPAAK